MVKASQRFKDAIIVHGREFISGVASGGSIVGGQALVNLPVSPADWQGTRLELFSRMYEKYLFKRLKFIFIPAVTSTTAGSLILAYDRDPSDATPPAGPAGIRQFLSWANTLAGDVKLKLEINCPLLAPDTGYYVNDIPGGDERLSDQGQIYVACLVPPPINTTLGSLIVEYECEFFIPNMENQSPLDISIAAPATAGSSTDVLKKVATGTAALASDPLLKPVVDSLGKYFVKLAEGLYRANVAGIHLGGTAQQFQTPTLTFLDPRPAPAPQPTVQVVTNTPGNGAAGSPYQADYMFNVPSGGANLYWDSLADLVDDDLHFALEKVSKGYFTGSLSNYA
jgi:hypothetical protein